MNHSTGSVMLETVIALPVVLVLGFSLVQWAFVFQARAAVDHATLMAARAGSVENAQIKPMRQAFARALVAIETPKQTATDYEKQFVTQTLPEAHLHTRFAILSPSADVFADHGQRDKNGDTYLPFRDLHHQPDTPGPRSGLSAQQAAWLELEITYGYKLNVPYANAMILLAAQSVSRLTSAYDRREQVMLASGRLPIKTTATVRLQSRARPAD